MGGLRRIAKAYGGIVINGSQYVWDYAADEPVRAEEMPLGSDRWKASERAHLTSSNGAGQ
jgi:hypothetical protein